MPKGAKTKKAASWVADAGLKAFAVFLLFGVAAITYSQVTFPGNGPNPVTGLVGQFVGVTLTNYIAPIPNGYQGATQACRTDFPNYPRVHVCTSNELINSYNNNATDLSSAPDRAWFNGGPPSAAITLSNDCQGWTKTDSTSSGNIWSFSRESGYISRCNVPYYPFACCQ